MKFKLVENIDQPLLEKGSKGQGDKWKKDGLGKKYGFNEDDYVVHHINGDHSADTRDDGSTNLSLIPKSVHDSFKRNNEAGWEGIKSEYDIIPVKARGRDFLLAIPKSKPQPSSSTMTFEKDLVGAGI